MNLALSRLDLVLKLMLEHGWPSYHFPGGNTLSLKTLSDIRARGICLQEKSKPDHFGQPRRCWANAKSLQDQDSRFEYWEGFIANSDSAWPTPHAWNVFNG